MIVVAGTKRSGTSMWMQVLEAAGFPVIGDQFPLNWQQSIGDANPRGFFESLFRDGVYYRTNPHPETGAFLRPDQVVGKAVKVFPYGLVRSDLAYIEKVVGTFRSWCSYVPSMDRLLDMEASHFARVLPDAPVSGPRPVPHWVAWWLENFQLFRDIATRGYPAVVHSYESVIRDPERVAGPVLRWLDAPDVEAGLAAIDASSSSIAPGEWPESEPRPPVEFAEVFDELHGRIDARKPLDQALLAKMNEAFSRVVESRGIGRTGP